MDIFLVVFLTVFMVLCFVAGICCIVIGAIKDKEMIDMELKECVIRAEYFENEWGGL